MICRDINKECQGVMIFTFLISMGLLDKIAA